eukprot:2823284-Pyramimonas_sp.AAC.2
MGGDSAAVLRCPQPGPPLLYPLSHQLYPSSSPSYTPCHAESTLRSRDRLRSGSTTTPVAGTPPGRC